MELGNNISRSERNDRMIINKELSNIIDSLHDIAYPLKNADSLSKDELRELANDTYKIINSIEEIKNMNEDKVKVIMELLK